MGKYTEEYKAAIVRRMMPPDSESVIEMSRETGVTTNTLYTWRKQKRTRGVEMPGALQTMIEDIRELDAYR